MYVELLLFLSPILTMNSSAYNTCTAIFDLFMLITFQKSAGDSTSRMQFISSADGEWMKPETLDDLLALLAGMENNVRYQLVAGNTGKGIALNNISVE